MTTKQPRKSAKKAAPKKAAKKVSKKSVNISDLSHDGDFFGVKPHKFKK